MEFLKANLETPVQFISCGQFVALDKWTHMKRVIDNYELIIGVKNTIFIRQENKEYEVNPGDILLLYPGYTHSGYRYSDKGTSFYWMHFLFKNSFSHLNQKEANSEILPMLNNPMMNKKHNSIILPNTMELSQFEALNIKVRQLFHATTEEFIYPFALDYLLTSILIEISSQYLISKRNVFDRSKPAKLYSVVEWIKLNIEKDITIDEIATEFSYNKDYLTRLFKKHLGVNLIQYINNSKIVKAKELLINTDMTIKEIAYFLSFKDEKYFMRLFKDYENITPTGYRNAYYKGLLFSR
ncbi:AraC family transcriptional regulator [Clostridium cellulovorans]|uniref:Transcriptional regulator, AraC family n=1 Tax=Clostridium cellulovorans (strain ATCC 35296 / DSM 3052 / OCM 3 / 743B) TaxID=573061 RepID=D9STN2_CLOC7|nr:AraC family transcriptional regulator [Clostridium cellulovorans]ADL52766.1 transcriptional regulator, AraC family [Clostridium cellulovorans 743B]